MFYTKNTNKPYSGPIFSLFDDGKKKEEGTIKDGKMISKTKWEWYGSGQKMKEEVFKNGKDDGLWTSWFENGQKKSEGNYKWGVEDGLWTEWYENGQKKEEITYNYGEYVRGSRKDWNKDGSVQE